MLSAIHIYYTFILFIYLHVYTISFPVHTYGDPIIETVDKVVYSFEGRGEFIYLNTR